MSTVTVGCKLPNGLIIEMGYSIEHGQIVRAPNYKRVELNGANSRRHAGVEIAMPDFVPGITENVDEAFFDAWMASHQDLGVVKNKLVWKVKNTNEALARSADETKKKIGMEPLNGALPGGGISRRTDSDDNGGFGTGFTSPTV